MKNIRSRRGQSIVEALVALSLLVVALLGIETLLARSFLLDRVTTDQTKATYLASEGVEIMKSLLDHQIYDAVANGVGGLANDPDAGGWPSFCGLSAGSFSYYQVDWKATSCPSSYAGNASAALTNADYLSFNKVTGLYSYNDPSGTATVFKRVIEVARPIDKNGLSSEIDIMSTVTWSTGSVAGQSLTVEDHFYNWNPESPN